MKSATPGWLGTLPYLIFALNLSLVFPITPDDPYITLRYAANLIAGHGPVYNIGERVEGYSSPMHLLVCAGLLMVSWASRVDPLILAKLSGIGCAVLTIYQTGKLAEKLRLSGPESVIAQCLLAANINFSISAVNGLETTLYACVLLWAVTAFSRECELERGSSSALLVFLALLVRPEAVLIFAALLCVRGYLRWGPARSNVSVWPWASLFGGPFVGLTLWRLLYYRAPLANTYYAKAIPLRGAIANGARYLLGPLSPKPAHLFANESPVTKALLLAALVAYWACFIFGVLRLRKNERAYPLLAVVLATVAFVLKAGGDWMQGWRFMIGPLPILSVVQCFGLRTVRSGAEARLSFARLALASGTLLVSVAVAPKHSWASVGFSLDGRRLLSETGSFGTIGRTQVAAADLIRTSFARGATLAYSEMGYAGFTNMDKSIVDVRGLTDREIARLPASLKWVTGVNDPAWDKPSSPLYQILVRRPLDGVVSFDDRPVVLERFHKRGGPVGGGEPSAFLYLPDTNGNRR